MPGILKSNLNQKNIAILKLESPYEILYEAGKSTTILQENGKRVCADCINCVNPKCMFIEEDEIKCDSFSAMSNDMMMEVCPANALKNEAKSISIDHSKCIGCGLCVQRCPVGALYLNDGKASVNTHTNAQIETMVVNQDNIRKQEEFLSLLGNIPKTGTIQTENNKILEKIYNSIRAFSLEQQNIFARNIMISLGSNATISRHGNVYTRMDGYYETVDQHGVLEVETGKEMLDVSRALLDDVAVLQARYDIEKSKNHPLAICLELQNHRGDYWQVVKDIFKITHLQINTVTFGLLLICMWNLEEINDYDIFYIDVDNDSLRKKAEDFIGRKINLSTGFLGILEISK